VIKNSVFSYPKILHDPALTGVDPGKKFEEKLKKSI
jgi:hypothetical protein